MTLAEQLEACDARSKGASGCSQLRYITHRPVDSVLDVVILFRLIVIITLGACLTQGCMTAAAMYVLNRTSTS